MEILLLLAYLIGNGGFMQDALPAATIFIHPTLEEVPGVRKI